jgi:hypothetical protein
MAWLNDLFSQAGAVFSAPAKASRALPSNGAGFTAVVEGADIVVRDVIVTVFGEGHDNRTESGDMNPGRNRFLMGCALPVRHHEAAGRPGPLVFLPPIPWGTRVEFWRAPDESDKIVVALIANDPNGLKYPDHAGGLTVAAASHFSPEMPLHCLANAFKMRLNYRILNGAQYVRIGAAAPSISRQSA